MFLRLAPSYKPMIMVMNTALISNDFYRMRGNKYVSTRVYAFFTQRNPKDKQFSMTDDILGVILGIYDIYHKALKILEDRTVNRSGFATPRGISNIPNI